MVQPALVRPILSQDSSGIEKEDYLKVVFNQAKFLCSGFSNRTWRVSSGFDSEGGDSCCCDQEEENYLNLIIYEGIPLSVHIFDFIILLTEIDKIWL